MNVSSLAGTWRLVRLALRRDRVKLPLVIFVLVALFASSVVATIDIYGSDYEQQLIYASTTAPSVVSRVFGGPIDGPYIGAIVLNETFAFTALAVAFMSTLTIVRHTRQNEEFGRSELIESGIVGRHASLFAAYIVTLFANILFAGLAMLILLSNDLPVAGSVGTGLAFGAIGIIFAAIAAVTAQLADSARGANSMAAMVIGVTFLLRGIGDGLGTLSADGMSVKSALPSWLSPFGWGQQMQPFTQGNWWIFGLYAAAFLVLTALSLVFVSRRDIGLGMISTRPGLAHAQKGLLSAFGLATRLQKGILRGWAIAIIVLGVSYGAVIREFKDLITENAQMAEIFGQYGGDFTKSFVGYMAAFMAITIAGYSTQAILRMRSEESGGQLESVLGTSVSRRQWLMSHLGFVSIGVIVLSLLSAISMGVTFVVTTGESWSWLWSIIGASLVQSLAVFAFLGFLVAVFSLLPRAAVALAWGSFAGTMLIMQIGTLLKLPQWIVGISPFGHLPTMPAESFELAPVLWLSLSAVGFLAIAVIHFNSRDITTT